MLKTFDRIDHYTLFIILIENSALRYFLKVKVVWCLRLQARVRWNATASSNNYIKCGFGKSVRKNV